MSRVRRKAAAWVGQRGAKVPNESAEAGAHHPAGAFLPYAQPSTQHPSHMDRLRIKPGIANVSAISKKGRPAVRE